MAMGVLAHVELVQVSPQDDAIMCTRPDMDLWSCPKDEQVPPPRGAKSVLLATPMVTATPTPLSVQARGQQLHNVALSERRSHGPLSRTVEELNRENEQLQTVLEGKRAERRRQEENGQRMRSRLQQLEVEVRGHWQSRVADLEAEVAELKGALADATAASRAGRARLPYVDSGLEADIPLLSDPQVLVEFPHFNHASAVRVGMGAVAGVASACAPMRVRSRSGSDIGAPRLPWWAPAADSNPAIMPRRDDLHGQPSSPVAMLHSVGSSPQSPALPSSNSPRARRPPLPPTRGSLAAEALLPDDSAWHATPGAMFHSSLPKGFFRSTQELPACVGIIAPRTPNGKLRSRSLPPSPTRVEDDGTANAGSFLGGFGGFYKQLVHGTQCTGPDALAVNESSHEIDLSAEFPPERRMAQVDPLNLQPYTAQQFLHSSLASREFSREFVHQRRTLVAPIMHHL